VPELVARLRVGARAGRPGPQPGQQGLADAVLQGLHALAQDDRQHEVEGEDADASEGLVGLAVQALEGFVQKQPAADFDGLLFLSTGRLEIRRGSFLFQKVA
jgi:hypothetical protein